MVRKRLDACTHLRNAEVANPRPRLDHAVLRSAKSWHWQPANLHGRRNNMLPDDFLAERVFPTTIQHGEDPTDIVYGLAKLEKLVID